MLSGETHLPPFSSTRSALNPDNAATSRDAGRTCKPLWFLMTTETDSPLRSSASGVASGPFCASDGNPSCTRLASRAFMASAITLSISDPVAALTVAARVPSTSGAAHRRTFAAIAGSRRSSAVSALSRALPISIITSTWSVSATDSMASITLMGSVPIGFSGSSMPAAIASLQPSPVNICRASSPTPSPSRAL